MYISHSEDVSDYVLLKAWTRMTFFYSFILGCVPSKTLLIWVCYTPQAHSPCLLAFTFQTTLAHIIANSSKKKGTRFVTLSATSAKTNDVRDVIAQAQNEKRLLKRKTILFIDEIHRFNKSQQVWLGLPQENVIRTFLKRFIADTCHSDILKNLPVGHIYILLLLWRTQWTSVHVCSSILPSQPSCEVG